jgi:TATA-box binding protein (TBP) (component of TFIID and TFIIIB)
METFKYIHTLCGIRGALIQDARKPEPSWVRITTITMCSKSLKPLDLAKFREKFEPVFIRRKGSSFEGFKWVMQQTAFYNQVTISTEDVYSRKSVKLFPNGSIQVAGCSHPIDCARVLKQVAFVIEHATGTPVEFEPPSIQMINTNFSLNFSVNLRKVIDVFARKPVGSGLDSPSPTFKVTFNPERYSAVKLKFEPGEGMKQVTASIFSTGRIIVTGARTLTEIAEAYRILNESIGGEALVKRTEDPELFDNIMGAPFKVWDGVLRRKNLV